MSIVHKKLGNGFRIKGADSSKDQEHQFGGTKKHIKVRLLAETYDRYDPDTIVMHEFYRNQVDAVDSIYNGTLSNQTGLAGSTGNQVRFENNGEKFDYHLEVATTASYIEYNINSLLNMNSGTVEFWHRPGNAVGINGSEYFVIQDSTEANYIRMDYQDGVRIRAKTNTTAESTLTVLPEGYFDGTTLSSDFHHHVITWDSEGGEFRFYYDGKLQGTGSYGAWSNAVSKFRLPESGSDLGSDYDFIRVSKGIKLSGDFTTKKFPEGYIDRNIAITGTTPAEVGQVVYDSANTRLIDTDFISNNLGKTSTVGNKGGDEFFPNEVRFSAYVSASSLPVGNSFSKDDIDILVRNDTDDSYVNLTTKRDFVDSDNGWKYIEGRFSDASDLGKLKVTLDNPSGLSRAGYVFQPRFILSSSAGKNYTFKDVGLEFDVPLTDGGVSKYREIDNQNLSFQYINPSLLKPIDADILDNSYYGWDYNNIISSDANTSFATFSTNKIVRSSSGILFLACSVRYSGQNDQWTVYRSDDGGKKWYVVDQLPSTSIANSLTVDSNNNIYVVGYETVTSEGQNWIVRKSTTGNSGSFSYIDSVNRDNSNDVARGVAVDSSNNVYVVGSETVSGENTNWIVRKSTTGNSGSFSYIDSVNRDNSVDDAYGIDIDSSGNIYVVGTEVVSGESFNWIVRKSTTGNSGSFSYIDSVNRDNDSDIALNVTVDSNNNIYVVGYETVTSEGQNWIVRKSTTGNSGSFSYIDSVNRDNGVDIAYDITFDSKNRPYAVGQIDGKLTLRSSIDGASGSFFSVMEDATYNVSKTLYAYNDQIGIVASSGKKADFLLGSLTSNSSSIGEKSLSFSNGYIQNEDISGSLYKNFVLSNIQEFPHFGGFFQMPSLILGTQQTGRLGSTNEDLIQNQYIGSLVRILWPSQGKADTIVAGFGDLSRGQRPGKLTDTFVAGDFINVEEYDHMSLYCYARKELSGTLDAVQVQVERRPTKSAPYASEHAKEYEISGSYYVANMKPFIHSTEIDYGDLTIREIGYPIDIPLTNVKDIKISARHRTGQSDDKNKNFIIWGRLINTKKET